MLVRIDRNDFLKKNLVTCLFGGGGVGSDRGAGEPKLRAQDNRSQEDRLQHNQPRFRHCATSRAILCGRPFGKLQFDFGVTQHKILNCPGRNLLQLLKKSILQ